MMWFSIAANVFRLLPNEGIFLGGKETKACQLDR